MPLLDRRQSLNNDDNGLDDDSWWWSPTAYAIKWAIVAAIFLIFLTFFGGGYLHARRRMKRGLAPLAYHRWMVPQRQQAQFYAAHPNLPGSQRYNQQQHQFSFYRPGYGDSRAAGAYPMGAYGPPPPAYGQEEFVPAYTPPQGPNKVNPDQSYAPPERPPPGQTTGAVNAGEGSGRGGGSHPGGDLGSRP